MVTLNQTKLGSLRESLDNVVIGYLFGLAMQLLLFPVVGLDVSLVTNMELSLYFTVTSITRSYLIRRYHNHKLRKKYLGE